VELRVRIADKAALHANRQPRRARPAGPGSHPHVNRGRGEPMTTRARATCHGNSTSGDKAHSPEAPGRFGPGSRPRGGPWSGGGYIGLPFDRKGR
jgi:hypothetical protein